MKSPRMFQFHVPALVASLLLLVSISLPGCSGCSQIEQTVTEVEAAEPAEEAAERNQPAPRSQDGSKQPPAAEEARQTEGRTDDAIPGASAERASAGAALSEAQELHERSKRRTAAGDSTGAFTAARDAWDLVRRFPDDPACRSLSEKLFAELDDLAEGVESRSPSPTTDDRPLIEK